VPLCHVGSHAADLNRGVTSGKRRLSSVGGMIVRRLLVRLPDRPGSLGRVTTLLGRLGIDIREVRILARHDATATDEFLVAVPGPVLDACLVDLLEELDDVRVLAVEPAAVERAVLERTVLESAQPHDGLVQHLVALAEREPDQPLALSDMVVEDLGGHRHDPAPLRK
jgi:ACT domain-containing protein